MELKQNYYAIKFKMFTGDEYEGESVVTKTIEQADSDKEAIEKSWKRFKEERNPDEIRLISVTNVTQQMNAIMDAVQEEFKNSTVTQRYNIAFTAITDNL